ncbi:thyroid stimulating hormone subunit beta a [Brachyhypopomus gauderio]|uniref:thyroid stimulating hormone subunit beta a n=1 Tax=Brachyhypopomus gauderio TaxID=698409 RepID=UPI0040420D6C
MPGLVLVVGILGLLVRMGVPVCLPTAYTLYIEKPECDYCVAVNTTICMGFCFSRDSNIKELVGPRFLIQRSCTYEDVEYRTAVLHACAPHADPHVTYPVAARCHCGRCNTRSHECVHKSARAATRCSKPARHLYAEPAASDHAQLGWAPLFE